jgi:hypothetical protein
MSQEVDLSKPLSDKDRAYLLGRGRYGDIERSDNMYGGSTPDEMLVGDGTGTRPTSILTSDQAAARKQQLLDELAAIEATEGATVPEADVEDEALKPYEEMTVAELDAELKARSLSTSGKQVEKIARLHADDAAE